MDKILNKIIDNNRYLINTGKPADYIPALSKVNRDLIGLSIIDMEGSIYNCGDYSTKFTIQSISKVFSLILALRDQGEDRVFSRVGYEATDESFNSMYKLDLNQDKPSNPMINSGAIVTTSLIKGRANEKFERLLDFIRLAANNPNLNYNKEVYESEKETGYKNFSMAYLMKAKGVLEAGVEETLDAYFKQCSIEVTTEDLARLAFFILNKCPIEESNKITNERITSLVTAIMATSGMYNFSGQYGANVGIPSKSGVGGGILGLCPGKYGLGVFSPGLDKYGNSAVGYGIMKDLSRELNLSIF